ncbi:MAG: hypothetical protein ACPG2Y_03425, partial [Acholeplasmataceae bacterium]
LRSTIHHILQQRQQNFFTVAKIQHGEIQHLHQQLQRQHGEIQDLQLIDQWEQSNQDLLTVGVWHPTSVLSMGNHSIFQTIDNLIVDYNYINNLVHQKNDLSKAITWNPFWKSECTVLHQYEMSYTRDCIVILSIEMIKYFDRWFVNCLKFKLIVTNVPERLQVATL